MPEPNTQSKLAQQYPVTVTGVFGVTTNKADMSIFLVAKMAYSGMLQNSGALAQSVPRARGGRNVSRIVACFRIVAH